MLKNKIIEILKKPADERAFSRFNPEFLVPRQELSNGEHERLRSLFPRSAGLPKRDTFMFLVNLSYASSRLEGNTYSEIDTVTLLEDNIPSASNSAEETKMIINHKRAFDLLISSKTIDREFLCEIHSRLADNTGVESSRHFLDPDLLGKVRTFEPLRIDNSSYSPLIDYFNDDPKISDYLDRIIANAGKINNPLEKSFYLFTRIPYLQPFNDCNKRTSRLAGNLPLLLSKEYPISFMGFSRPDYNRSIVAFYEFGNSELFKDGFIEAYLHSALKFHPLPSETSIMIQSRNISEVRKELLTYVIEGKDNHASDVILSATKAKSQPNEDYNPGM